VTEQERKLLALLQFLTPESYNAIVSSFGGGTAGDDDIVNKMSAMGTDAYDAYQSLINGINTMGWDDAAATFDAAVADGTIAITPDTAEIIKNSTLSSLGKQGTSAKTPGEVFSALGAPELALLAPYAQDKPMMTPTNPYNFSSTLGDETQAKQAKRDYEKTVKETTATPGINQDILKWYASWKSRNRNAEPYAFIPALRGFVTGTPSKTDNFDYSVSDANFWKRKFDDAITSQSGDFRKYQNALSDVNQQQYQNDAADAYQRGVDRAMQKIQPTMPGQAFDEQKMRLLLSFLGQQGQ
jgi:hypothetical protein